MRLFRFRKRISRRQLMHEIKMLKAHLLQTKRQLRGNISDSNYILSQDINKHMELIRRDIQRAIESKNIKKDPFAREMYQKPYKFERYFCPHDDIYRSKDVRLMTSGEACLVLDVSRHKLRYIEELDVKKVDGFNYYLARQINNITNPPISL